MADNISVKITADVVDLQSQFSVAKAESSALTQELNKLARAAAQTGMTDQLKASLDKAAESALGARAKVAELGAQLKELAPAAASSSAALQDLEKDASLVDRAFVRMAAAAAAYKAINFLEDSLDLAAGVQHTADVLGITTDQLQAFQFAARQSGVETSDASMMLTRFMANMGGLQHNTGPAVQAVKDLGLTADELAGDPMAALQKIALALIAIKDPTERASDEMEIFGRSGLDLSAMLPQLAQGFDTLRQKASDAGEMLSPELTKEADDAKIKLASFTAWLEGEAAEGLMDYARWAGEAGSAIHKFAQEFDAFLGLSKAPEGDPLAWLHGKQKGMPAPFDVPKTTAMPDAGAAPTIDIVDPKKAEEEARKAAEIARRLSDEIAQDSEALSLKQISAAESANNFALSMGDESLDQWKAKAVEETDAKLAAELKYLNAKAAADKGNVVEEQKDLDQIRLAHQEHANALQQIDQQYAEKKRAIAQEELSEFISADNAKLQDGIRALEEEYRTHQITAQQRYTLEQQLTQEIYSEELKRLDTLLATLTQGTKAYEDAIKQREKIEQEFTKQSQANTSQLETEEAAKWTQLGNSIKSSFNSAIDGMLFQGRTFGQGMVMIAEGVAKAFLEMGEKMLEDWVVTQLEQLVITKTTGAEQATSQITSAAAVAGAQGTASFAGAPWPIDMGAPEFGASMSAAALAYSSMLSLDVGAWDMKSDSIAQLHKGEMVVPENFASGLRSNGSGMGGGTHVHIGSGYSPSINAPGQTVHDLVRNNYHEFQSEIVRLVKDSVRNGSLRF